MSEGVGSSRGIDRQRERDNAYRGLCGEVEISRRTVADVGTEDAAWLNAKLTRGIPAQLARKPVTLNFVAQDTLGMCASARAANSRRQARLQPWLSQARLQVQALKAELGAEQHPGLAGCRCACRA